MADKILIRGAKEHNLKNISVEIPKNKLIVFTGVSGSGKSSLAFDTIYAEGQRRYVESLSTYARQFLGVMDKPDVELIEGLSPAISIDQKTTSHNPRSTVGTITEIYDYLRLLFARIGHPHCPNCQREISKLTLSQITEFSLDLLKKLMKEQIRNTLRIMILSPVVRDRKGEFSKLFENLKSKGYQFIRIDGQIFSLDEELILLKTNRHSIDVVIDRISINKKSIKNVKTVKDRLLQGIEQALHLSQGLVFLTQVNDSSFDFPINPQKFTDHLYSERFACAYCNISLAEIEPRMFSFNSPHGACPKCSGIGVLLKVDANRILNLNLSISEGAILPFSKLIFNDTWYGRIIIAFSKKIGVDIKKPLKHAFPNQLNQLLYGDNDETLNVSGENRYGKVVTINEKFNGLVSDLEKRYQETESEYVRNEISKYLKKEICPACQGKRLKNEALSVTIDQKSIIDICSLDIDSSLKWIKDLPSILNEREIIIANLIIKEITSRLSFLLAVGLNYLTLDRSAESLAGGEAQRIRLASQIGSGLSGVLYVLDEPSIGLHQRDNIRLINTLKNLRDLGNTVIVVEHDREIMENADLIYDFGPGAGKEGGNIIVWGNVSKIKNTTKSLTGLYLTRRKKIDRLFFQRKSPLNDKVITLSDCGENNLKNIKLTIPLNKFICVTGVSGSGKSTLIVDTLYQIIAKKINPYHREKIGKYSSIQGLEYVNRIILIDQSPIGRTPRSNPATYSGSFTLIRELFSITPEARARGFNPGRFSFNIKGGRCEVCQGEGQTKIEMQFLPDVYVTCEVCQGLRYNKETLDIRYKEKNIAQVLAMTVKESLDFFQNIPALRNKLETLYDVGLGYIQLGQPAPHLSGGEAQRVKLATELSKKATRNTIFILDEPTTGLHFDDLKKLIYVLHKLVDIGNTVIVIEHNLDVIKNSDWIIDLGPEGGNLGGEIIAYGTPGEIAQNKKSYTGFFLKKILKAN